MSLPTVTAGEPTAAGALLIGLGISSGMPILAALGGSLTGAGASVAIATNQLKNARSRAVRFLVSAFSSPIFTLAGVEIAHSRGIYPGPFVVSLVSMLIAFIAWTLFSVLHNRSNRIAGQALDKALDIWGNNGQASGINWDVIDTGRAARLLARIKEDEKRQQKTNAGAQGGDTEGEA